MEFTGITFAGQGQNLDTGAKVVHNAPETSSYMNARSISKERRYQHLPQQRDDCQGSDGQQILCILSVFDGR